MEFRNSTEIYVKFKFDGNVLYRPCLLDLIQELPADPKMLKLEGGMSFLATEYFVAALRYNAPAIQAIQVNVCSAHSALCNRDHNVTLEHFYSSGAGTQKHSFPSPPALSHLRTL